MFHIFLPVINLQWSVGSTAENSGCHLHCLSVNSLLSGVVKFTSWNCIFISSFISFLIGNSLYFHTLLLEFYIILSIFYTEMYCLCFEHSEKIKSPFQICIYIHAHTERLRIKCFPDIIHLLHKNYASYRHVVYLFFFIFWQGGGVLQIWSQLRELDVCMFGVIQQGI